jgi:glycosyltransferase involved in cell wall biosynthesis
MEMNVSVVMPAYNAQAHLEAVFKRIPDIIWANVTSFIVVNDGSSDNTGALIDDWARSNPKIKPVHFEKNRGYGAAMKVGLMSCKNGQYPPEILPSGLETMVDRKLNIMQGSRIASGTALSGGMPVYKYLANRALTYFENKVFGLSMTDYHSGMIFYGKKALATLPFETFSDSFDFDLEVIASGRARGLSIGEIPIPTHYGDERSHVKSIPYGFRALKVMGKYLFGGYKPS